MDENVILFPSHKIGLHADDNVAVVTNAENGRAVTIKTFPDDSDEIGVFAHNDLIMDVATGDWVRFEYTKYGALIVDRLAKPGEKPLPRIEYSNGCVQIDQNDPAWRLYSKMGE